MIVKEKEFSENYLDELVALPKKQIAPGEIILGTIVEFDQQGKASVDFPGCLQTKAISAMAAVSISPQHLGRQVALLFIDNDLDKPIIIGLIHSPLQNIIDNFELTAADNSAVDENNAETDKNENKPVTKNVDDMFVDGERVVFEAKKEIVFKCGESSITLTKAGKILIKGKYLLNRSSGVNRIVGGSVQIN